MSDKLLGELRAQHEHGLQTYVGDLCGRAKDEIERLSLLAHMLANDDPNGVAYMLCEHPHLADVLKPPTD